MDKHFELTNLKNFRNLMSLLISVILIRFLNYKLIDAFFLYFKQYNKVIRGYSIEI
jgi:hypothetical protein